jgi:hypothetical protein
LADEVDDLLYRNVPDQSLATDLQAARQRIAKTYDVQNALTSPDSGIIDARKLATASKKRPLSGGTAEAASFAGSHPELAQVPKGDTWTWGNAGLNSVLGLGGLGEMYYGGDPWLGAAIMLGRPGAKAALGAIYARAAKQGNMEAAKHASRLSALLQSAMGPKAQVLARESAEYLTRNGYLGDATSTAQ